MDKKFNLTKQLPEPFNTSLQLSDFIFDYHLMPNKSDHKWLTERGYELEKFMDCTYRVTGISGLLKPTPNLEHNTINNAISYGDWGAAYYDEKDWPGHEGFDLFCEMYNEGIVTPWRIWIYHDSGMYCYDHDKDVWTVNHRDGSYSWVECENPLPKILSEINKNNE